MEKIGFLFIVILLAGCAISKQVYMPDGQAGYSVTCSGTLMDWSYCYQKAGELCGAKGYEILEKSGDQGAMVSGNQYGMYGSTVINRTMLIKCKP